MCGACTVHLEGRAIRSCITPVSAVGGAEITTIEGLDPQGSHQLQRAWIACWRRAPSRRSCSQIQPLLTTSAVWFPVVSLTARLHWIICAVRMRWRPLIL